MEKIFFLKTYLNNKIMKKQIKMVKRKSLSENSIEEFGGGFVLLPYHLANAAAAAKKLIDQAIGWLTTQH